MSFHLRTSIVFAPSSNRPAIAARASRSPSCSIRWISTTNLSLSLKPRRLARASWIVSQPWTISAACLMDVFVGAGTAYRTNVSADLFDEIQDVVQAADQGVDVLAVERRDEGSLQATADVVADLVAPVLDLADLLGCLVRVVVGPKHRFQLAGAVEHVGGVLNEQVEEALIARDQSKGRHRYLRCIAALGYPPRVRLLSRCAAASRGCRIEPRVPCSTGERRSRCCSSAALSSCSAGPSSSPSRAVGRSTDSARPPAPATTRTWSDGSGTPWMPPVEARWRAEQAAYDTELPDRAARLGRGPAARRPHRRIGQHRGPRDAGAQAGDDGRPAGARGLRRRSDRGDRSGRHGAGVGQRRADRSVQ